MTNGDYYTRPPTPPGQPPGPPPGPPPGHPTGSGNDWDPPPPPRGGVWTHLGDDGQHLDVAVLSKPLGFRKHRGGPAGTRCPERGCHSCAVGDQPQQRYLLEIWTDGARHALEISDSTYRTLYAVKHTHPSDRYRYRITRRGRRNDQRTTYPITVVGEITPEERAAAAATPPLDLEALSWGGRRGPPRGPTPPPPGPRPGSPPGAPGSGPLDDIF